MTFFFPKETELTMRDIYEGKVVNVVYLQTRGNYARWNHLCCHRKENTGTSLQTQILGKDVDCGEETMS